jgi:hypothetical protein
MVQAAKLIGAGSALIALAGVGAGIGIVFGSRALLSYYFYVVVKIHLSSPYTFFGGCCKALLTNVGSKARSLRVLGNREAQSGNESHVSNGSICETHRQARIGMAKLMNLRYTFSVIKHTVIHISLKNHFAHDSLPGIKGGLTRIVQGASHQESTNVQEPKPVDRMYNGTAGLPKGRKAYGNGAFIVGSRLNGFYCTAEGRQAIRCKFIETNVLESRMSRKVHVRFGGQFYLLKSQSSMLILLTPTYSKCCS